MNFYKQSSMVNLNILEGEVDIAIIGLNPTKEAIQIGAVFSRDRGFWNILEKAGIIRDTSNVLKENLAKEVFLEHKHSKFNVGFADLLPHIDETDSSKVKVEIGYARNLVKTLAVHKTKKVALMGQKVVDGFSKEYPKIKRWNQLEKMDNKKQYGKIGEINFEGHKMEIYAMPFPVNTNIPNKHLAYNKLI